MIDKENAILSVGALDVKRPQIQVSDGINQIAKLLDPPFVDKPVQKIRFLDEVTLRNVVRRVSQIRQVKTGNKLVRVGQLPHLAKLCQ